MYVFLSLFYYFQYSKMATTNIKKDFLKSASTFSLCTLRAHLNHLGYCKNYWYLGLTSASPILTQGAQASDRQRVWKLWRDSKEPPRLKSIAEFFCEWADAKYFRLRHNYPLRCKRYVNNGYGCSPVKFYSDQQTMGPICYTHFRDLLFKSQVHTNHWDLLPFS